MIDITVTTSITDITVIMIIIVAAIADAVISGGKITKVLTSTMLIEQKATTLYERSPFDLLNVLHCVSINTGYFG